MWLPGGMHGSRGMHGCQRACVAAGGMHGCWLGGMCGCWLGGVHGCWGVHGCGGVHGCWGVCMVVEGACVVVGGVHGCRGLWIGYDEIRSMSRWYASYWNAFLLLL